MAALAGSTRETLRRSLGAVAIHACIVRYRLDRPIGALYLLAAVLDPFVYAGVIYFALSTVFSRDDPSRFPLLLMSVIAFRWTLSCAIHALHLHVIQARMSEASRYGYIGAIIAVVAPPTLAFILALSLAMAWSIIANVPGRSLAAVWTLPGVILFQLLWNCVLVAVIDWLRRARIITGQAPVIAAAAIVWFLSPIMYRLGDIPVSASLLLTSYNPVSHVIAAYQNAYWYGDIPSMTVLPAATMLVIVGTLLAWVLRTRFVPPHPAARYAAAPGSNPQIMIVGNASPALTAIRTDAAGEPPAVYSRWQGQMKDIRGSGLVRLIAAVCGLTRSETRTALKAIKHASGLDSLYEEDIGVYPEWAQDQLAFTIAIESSKRNLVLNGLLNNASPAFLAAAWQRIESDASHGRLITVIADRALPFPASAQASLRSLGASRVS
ncbi:MAG: hypothetical protein AB7M05_03185 [Alphaproteobacteria bacterium]